MKDRSEYDAVVIGSGPNGLAAAITLQRAGLSVLLLEGKETIGGGMRTRELTLPGFRHDVCSAVHPMAAASPFFAGLPLAAHGLTYCDPPVLAAHPLEGRSAACLYASPEKTAETLGPEDAKAYRKLITPLLEDWAEISDDVLGPFRFPARPVKMAGFGMKALRPATALVRRFSTDRGRGLWAGMAAHSQRPLSAPLTSAIGLVLLAAGHLRGWPLAAGGSQSLAGALASYFVSLGGRIETGIFVRSLSELPSHRALLLDVTPAQLLQLAGHRFSSLYRWQLKRYRYGMGVFKVDWALAEPVPFRDAACRQAGTVHLGGSFEEIAAAEREAWRGRHTGQPFVLLAQPSLFDPSRAPAGKHTAWAYCHVPNGSVKDMTAAIEQQVERFAPGFRERILARHTMNTEQMEAYNPNCTGGDINGGAIIPSQLFTRPALRRSPYRTSARGIYICSSSTPPGGGVHGMCGFHAASRALKDIFGR